MTSSPVPCAAGDGYLTWTPLNIQPVVLTIRVSDVMFSSYFAPILQVCNCLNGGTCQYNSITENHLLGKFQVKTTVQYNSP